VQGDAGDPRRRAARRDRSGEASAS
jgi:hypothetical protein